MDDLQSIADDYVKLRRLEVSHCEKIIAEKVTALLEANKYTKPEEHK